MMMLPSVSFGVIPMGTDRRGHRPRDFTPVIRAFVASGRLAGHWWLWGGGGRITAGQLTVAGRTRRGAGADLVRRVTGADWSWSQRDEAMARRILAAVPPGGRTLEVAGGARTPASPLELGVPMGARLAAGSGPGSGTSSAPAPG